MAADAAGATAFADVLLGAELTGGGGERAFTAEEVMACIQVFGRTGRPLTWEKYRDFADEQMRRADREVTRFFKSRDLVHKHFGTWTRLLTSAGLGARLAVEYAHRAAPAGSREDYSEVACKRSLAAAAEELGATLTAQQYERFATDRERAAQRDGVPLVVPRRQTVRRVLGPWPVALHSAGVISEKEMRLRRSRTSRRLTDENLVSDLAESVRALGPRTSRELHDLYRLKLVGDGERVLASGALIRRRLGGWPRAQRLALDHLERLGLTLDEVSHGDTAKREALLQSLRSLSKEGET